MPYFYVSRNQRSFFPTHTYEFLDQLRRDIRKFLQLNYLHRKNKARNGDFQNASVREKLLEEEQKLLKMEELLYVQQRKLPQTFAEVLSFPQLITGATRTPI